VVNNSNTVEVVNAFTMESIQTISDVALPRYMISDDSNGYLSEWVSFSDPGRVSVINLETGDIIDRIEVGFGAENLLIRSGKLYVSNNFSSSISIVDLTSMDVAEIITVGNSPAGLVMDAGGNIWVICAGGYNEDWSPANNGQLLRINSNDEITYTAELEMNVSGKIAGSPDGQVLYFLSGSNAYEFNISAPDGFTEFASNDDVVAYYGIGVSENGNVYISDSKAFQANGVVYVYSFDGSLLTNHAAGRGPNGFTFQ
jgi:YVTN family beta-propeller protein